MLHKTIALMSVAAALVCTAALYAETVVLAERFTFVAANAPQDALNKDRRLSLTLQRWSTDAERDRMAAAVAEPAKLLDAFRDVGGIGYLQWPGGVEYTIRYAHRTQRPDGSADLTLVIERPLWVWWDTNAKWTPDPGFTLLQVRLNKDGTGEGRAMATTRIRSDKETGIALADTNAPVLLTDVRRTSERYRIGR
jgi:hypothetical protein